MPSSALDRILGLWASPVCVGACERSRSQFPTPTNNRDRGGVTKPWLGGRPKVTIRWVGKATWILFPPRALPIEKEIKLKTTEIGSLTEMVRP